MKGITTLENSSISTALRQCCRNTRNCCVSVIVVTQLMVRIDSLITLPATTNHHHWRSNQNTKLVPSLLTAAGSRTKSYNSLLIDHGKQNPYRSGGVRLREKSSPQAELEGGVSSDKIKKNTTESECKSWGLGQTRRPRTVDYPAFSYDLKAYDELLYSSKITSDSTGSSSSALLNEKKKKAFAFQKVYLSVRSKDGETWKNTTTRLTLTGDSLSPADQDQADDTNTLTPEDDGGGFNFPNPFSIFETDQALDILSKNKKTRLLENRAYASSEAFRPEANLYSPPTLRDLAPPPRNFEDTFWVSTSARLLTFFVPYLVFPYLVQFLDRFVTIPPTTLDNITRQFGPGVSILYGTFVALTLSILYKRQSDIQDNVAMESALLTLVTRNLLSMFNSDNIDDGFEDYRVIEVGQCSADQIRTLVSGSRGAELMLLMYNDPYARMLELVESKERDGDSSKASSIASCRDILKDMYKIRANRLSEESLALPPTHFFILTSLTVLILSGYIINILPTVDYYTDGGRPSNESSLIFGVLVTIYVLFYNFAKDLNDPFQGIYQVRRSATASHLLQAKWLLINHPLLQYEMDLFDEVQEDESGDVLIRTPGLGEMRFEKGEIYQKKQSTDSK